jgi:thiol-disulfide isomerase/thioredoxin
MGSRLACAAVLWLAVTGGALQAEELIWDRSCRFSVAVDGTEGTAGIVFERRGTPDMLGQLEDGAVFLLQPAQRRALTLDGKAVKLTDKERRAVLTGSLPSEGNPVRLTPSALTFQVGERWIKVLPTPPLLGEIESREFLDLCPDYEQAWVDYQPDSEVIRKLAAVDGGVSIEVYFGSWCPHCQIMVPQLMKSLEAAHNAELQVTWIALPRNFSREARVKERAVTAVPTVIVLQEGRELGRFTGTERIPVEASLANLVPQG